MSSWEEPSCVTVDTFLLIKTLGTQVKEKGGREFPSDEGSVWIQDILCPFWNNRNMPEGWSDSMYKS